MDLTLESLTHLNAEQLRELARDLIARIAQQTKLHVQAIATKDSDILYRQAKIDKLTHELATLKRWKFGHSCEQLNAGQISLIEEALETDIAAIEQELLNLAPPAKPEVAPRQQPKRAALPAELPRVEVRHDPDSTTCGCGCQLKRIGEGFAEKLDYTPGVFTVERHIRGKWVCDTCETLVQAPVPAQIIDKGIPTAGLLAQVLVAKYCDHLPLYRQENIFGHAPARNVSPRPNLCPSRGGLRATETAKPAFSRPIQSGDGFVECVEFSGKFPPNSQRKSNPCAST